MTAEIIRLALLEYIPWLFSVFVQKGYAARIEFANLPMAISQNYYWSQTTEISVLDVLEGALYGIKSSWGPFSPQTLPFQDFIPKSLVFSQPRVGNPKSVRNLHFSLKTSV